MKKTNIFLVLLTLFIINSAHEYILIAENFKLKKGDVLNLHLFVADGFNIEMERPFQASITKNFRLETGDQTINLMNSLPSTPLPILEKQVDFEGLGLIHMERDFAKITLDNKKFLAYLKEDHIENIQIDQTKQKEQKERYARYIKCLVQSESSKEDQLYKKQVGQKFEIILLNNPYQLKIGDQLKAQIFFDGKPLSNKVITIRNRTGGEQATKQTSRTNDKGICTFKLNRQGDWFIHATHMIKSTDQSAADWESHWTSYSFGM